MYLLSIKYVIFVQLYILGVSILLHFASRKQLR